MLVQPVKIKVFFAVKQRLKLNQKLISVNQKVKMTLVKVVLMLEILVLMKLVENGHKSQIMTILEFS